MAQTIDEILKELDAGYNPSRDLINKRLAAVPGEAEAQIAGLDAKKTAAFDSLLPVRVTVAWVFRYSTRGAG